MTGPRRIQRPIMVPKDGTMEADASISAVGEGFCHIHMRRLVIPGPYPDLPGGWCPECGQQHWVGHRGEEPVIEMPHMMARPWINPTAKPKEGVDSVLTTTDDDWLRLADDPDERVRRRLPAAYRRRGGEGWRRDGHGGLPSRGELS